MKVVKTFSKFQLYRSDGVVDANRFYIDSTQVFGIKMEEREQFVRSGYYGKVAKIEHNIYKMLDFEGLPCNEEYSYRLSECIFHEFVSLM